MDILNWFGLFLNVVAIAFVVVIILIGIGLIAAIIMLVKKRSSSGDGTQSTRRKTSPHKSAKSPNYNRSHFRTRRKLV